RSQGRGGRGITASASKEGDFIKDIFVASTHDYILFFTNLGRVYWLKVYECPEMSRTSRGRSLVNVIQLQKGETVTNQVCVHDFNPERYVVLATREGVIKKTSLEAFSRPKKNGIIAIGVRDEDKLIGASICGAGDEVILGTKGGMAIRFAESDIRPMGRTAMGVGGISLKGDDRVVDMVVVSGSAEGQSLLTACRRGFGKRTPVSDYRLQKRNGSGTINIRVTERNGPVVGMKAVADDDDIVLITKNGILIRTAVSETREIGRATQGVKLINVKGDDQLISIERVAKQDESEEGDSEGGESETAESASTEPSSEGATPAADSGDTPDTGDSGDSAEADESGETES
ncbi:MAG: DNA gyrase C-terminal beta-propeller domain-containing protein, partial [Planctomycetota bacterium]